MPTCPRCDYNLDGLLASCAQGQPASALIPDGSKDAASVMGDLACPLKSKCSECGLDFSWVEVNRPELFYPPWSYEHATLQTKKRLWQTLGMSLRPGKLWRELSIAAPVKTRRLLTIAIFAAVLAHMSTMLVALHSACEQYLGGVWSTGALSRLPLYLDKLLLAVAAPPMYLNDFPVYFPRIFGAILLMSIIMPFTFVLLPDTMARAKCRYMLLFRGLCVVMPMLATIYIVLQIISWTFALFPNILPTFSGTSIRQGTVWLAVSIPVVIIQPRWWYCFVKHHLRLPHAVGVVIAMMLMSFLASVAAFVYFVEA